MPMFWRVLIINGCSSLSKAFFGIYWEDHMVFMFKFVNMVYNIYLFAYIEEFLHPCGKPNLIMVCELFDVSLNSVFKNFVEDFCIYVHQWYWPVVFFSCVVCLALVSGWWWPCRICLEVFLPLQFFGRVLER